MIKSFVNIHDQQNIYKKWAGAKYTHAHTQTHIYSHPQKDCFVLSEFF